jgi:hypothetical protein
MPFLALNGWTIPVMKGGAKRPIIIGDRQRAFDGTLNEDRRVIKEGWRFTTKHLDSEDATALVGLLLGRGQDFDFDSDLFSGKGLSPGSTIGSRRFGIGVSDASTGVVDGSGIDESKFGERALAVEASTTNLLSESQRRASATTGFAVIVGGSLATDTTLFLNTGESTPTSVKHTRTALTQGVETNAISISASTDYAGSVYVYTAQAGVTVQVKLIDDVDDIDVTSLALERFKWNLITVSGTSDVAATTAQVQVTVTAGAAAGDIYTEAWQIEQNTSPTTWADGARAAGDLSYSPGFLGSEGITFAAWVKVPVANPSAIRYFVDIEETLGKNRFRMYRINAANSLTVAVIGPTGTQNTVTYSTTPWDDDWHHIAGVVGKGKDGTSYLRLFFDGSQVGEDTSIEFPDFTSAASFDLGHLAGGNLLYGLMDEVVVFPYPASSGLIAALAAATQGAPALPKLLATGDCISTDLGQEVEGIVDENAYNGVVLNGTFRNTAGAVGFELET